jgi:hypothetical protein
MPVSVLSALSSTEKGPYTNKIITAVEATKLSGSSALNQPPRSPTKCAGDAKEDRQD